MREGALPANRQIAQTAHAPRGDVTKGRHSPLRVAFITAGLYFDPTDRQFQARFGSFSGPTEGVVYGVIYSPDFIGARLGSYELRAPLLPSRLCGYGLRVGLERAWRYCSFVVRSFREDRKHGRAFDVIVAADPFKAGLLALIGSRILGVPFVVEVNGNYFASMGLSKCWHARLKARVVRAIIPFVLRRATAIKLLYEQQLAHLSTPAIMRKAHVFHDMVPLQPYESKASQERYVLLLGHPWLLKGADVAIRAFRAIADRHPDVHLRIVGYCPEPEAFEKLAEGHPRIHLQPAGVPYAEAVELVNACFALVLPSRTEGMGRVLLEAMAASKPVIGSRVDGIPRVIRHEHNGLLFECGDADDLARQLDRLMSNPDFARKLGENGKADVHTRLSPEVYAAEYLNLLRFAVRQGHSAARSPAME